MKLTRSLESIPPRYQNVYTRLVASDVTVFADLLALVRSEQLEHPDITVVITLDDLDQALYTSMHATESDELSIDTDDLDFLHDPQADEVNQRRQFAHTSAQLAAPELRVAWGDLRGTRHGSADDVEVLAAMNDAPAQLVDDVIMLLHVPGDPAAAALAAMPNGYFSVDWNTFQNHAVTRHLIEVYDYRPLGIGASWIGFSRDAPLSPDQAALLIAELTELYGAPQAPGWRRLLLVLTQQPTLFLGYTENFAE